MENKERLEQPDKVLTSNEDVEIMSEGGIETSGSNEFGKFKDAKALLVAYNNLHGEYTRKCQLLSAMQKKLEDNERTTLAGQTLDNEEKSSPKGAKKDGFLPESERVEGEISSDTGENKIHEEILTEEEKKDTLKKYVMQNEELRDFVVAKFFDENVLPVSPKLIGSDKGSVVAFAPVSRPRTLEEAEVLAKDLLKSNKK
jgi:hypothetical protein